MVALSAPQIGVDSRLFCIKFSGGDIRTFINPMIKGSKGMHLSREKCISIPDKEFIVPRNDEVEVIYQTPVAKIEENIMKDAVGEVFQQMVQLLDGILLSDIGLEVIEGWDEASEEEREEVIKAYLDGLKITNKGLQKDIEEHKDTKELSDAIEFMKGVELGTIETYQEQPHLNREQRRQLERLKKIERRKLTRVLYYYFFSNTVYF